MIMTNEDYTKLLKAAQVLRAVKENKVVYSFTGLKPTNYYQAVEFASFDRFIHMMPVTSGRTQILKQEVGLPAVIVVTGKPRKVDLAALLLLAQFSKSSIVFKTDIDRLDKDVMRAMRKIMSLANLESVACV